MADLNVLAVQRRENMGKGHNRRLRAAGMVPCVFYSREGEHMVLQVEERVLNKVYAEVRRTTVFNIELEGKQYPALVWDVLRDPCKSTFTHVDFYGVDLDRPVKITVPLQFEGTAKGTKVGGKLETYREKLVLIAKPLDMPASVVVDMTNLDLGETLSVGDLQLPEGVSAAAGSNVAIMSVIAPNTAKETEE